MNADGLNHSWLHGSTRSVNLLGVSDSLLRVSGPEGSCSSCIGRMGAAGFLTENRCTPNRLRGRLAGPPQKVNPRRQAQTRSRQSWYQVAQLSAGHDESGAPTSAMGLHREGFQLGPQGHGSKETREHGAKIPREQSGGLAASRRALSGEALLTKHGLS